jgi:Amt family ammonium transporter
MKILKKLCVFSLLALPASFAQSATDVQAKIASLEAATKSAQSAGDNAWMLISAALVLMMTGPGLALF